MKNRLNIKMLAGIILIALVSLNSCEDYLEIPLPTNSLASEGAFNEKVLIEKMVMNIYVQYKTYIAIPTIGFRVWELQSDNAYNPTITGTFKDAQQMTMTPDRHSSNNLNWPGLYTAIYLCNSMLENLPGVEPSVLSEDEKNAYIGAALTIRADAYFHLVQVYGDVPLVLSSDVEASKFLERSPVEAVYAQIEKDLTEAIAALPPEKGESYVIKSKYIPQSILARVYLTEGKWAEAETAASAVINSGTYSLDEDLDDVFLQTSPSTIMATGYTFDFSGAANLTADPGGLVTQPMSFLTARFEGTNPALSEYLVTSFEPGDMRKEKWVILINTQGYPNDNNRMWQNKYRYNADLGILPPPGREDDNKYIRFAELYLIRAEARAKKSTPDLAGAAADLNKIRNRADLDNTTATSQAALADAIIHERRVELFFENGTRWFDLLRLGIADQILSAIPYKTGWEPYKVLAPIPVVELQANPNLEQTPGWPQ